MASWRMTARPSDSASRSDTSLAREPNSWVIAMTGMALAPRSVHWPLDGELVRLFWLDQRHRFRDERPEQHGQRQRGDAAHQRVCPHDPDIALRDQHGLAER